MKLSISNIAWPAEYDNEMYSFLKGQEYDGLEIAPTRLFPQNPYDHIEEAKAFSDRLRDLYKLDISSVQSLWFGRSENIFNSEEERKFLLDYTKKAILFAQTVGCRNLVFGSPRNRNMPSPDCMPMAIGFFKEIGDFAARHNAIIAIEAIPPFYNTNFINTTKDAFEFCKLVNSSGLMVNIDLGTSIYYNEDMNFINSNMCLVNHIHISEPMLACIEKRELHKQLKAWNYGGYFSIEMKNYDNINLVKNVVQYIKDILK